MAEGTGEDGHRDRGRWLQGQVKMVKMADRSTPEEPSDVPQPSGSNCPHIAIRLQ